MKVQHKDGRVAKVTFTNYNPMAGLLGHWVKLEDGSTEFWTFGEVVREFE